MTSQDKDWRTRETDTASPHTVTSVRYVVPGRPVTWKRDNYVRGKYIVDAEVRRAKDAHRIVALAGLRASGYRGPFPLAPGLWGVEVVGYWPDGRHGDADRLLTLVLDAMEGVAYVADRAVKVAQVKVRQHDHPRVEVMLWRLDEMGEP